jgi:ferredoxin
VATDAFNPHYWARNHVMRRRMVVAVLLSVAGASVLAAAVRIAGPDPPAADSAFVVPADAYHPAAWRTWRPVVATAGAMLLAAGLLLLCRSGSTSAARGALLLDWFLPFLRKPKKNAPPRRESLWIRAARRVVPRGWLSDPVTGKPGTVRRVLKRLGISWRSSPLRRVVQALCFVAFLWLFFYVCWPYDAQPATLGTVWRSWRPVAIDDSGAVVLACDDAQAPAPVLGDVVYVQDESRTLDDERYLGACRVEAAGPLALALRGAQELSADDLATLLALSPGPWKLVDAATQRDLGSTWQPGEPSGASVVVQAARPGEAALRPGMVLTAYDPSIEDPAEQRLVDFRVAEVARCGLLLLPQGDGARQRWETAAGRGSMWTLSQRDPTAWPAHYADNLAAKERVAAETFLILDPLVSISTALAAKAWVWSLVFAAVILLVGVLVPRGFCGYICPLGTLIDLFDWAVGRRITRFRVPDNGWWVHLKYYLLLGALVAALGGVLLTGFVAAIPIITRGMLYVLGPLHTASSRGWHNVPPLHAGHFLSLALFLGVLGLGLLRPRFWCKYVCPSGAVFSVGNLLRASQRHVESSCIHCNKCVEVCPFDAIKPDFTTRTTDCTLCQTCGGVCPTQAIKFVERWNGVQLKVLNDPPTGETRLGRRGFLSAAVGTTAATLGGLSLAGLTRAYGAGAAHSAGFLPVRPPGSVPEPQFLQLCIRCGECFKACPNDVLQPLAFQQGLEGLWTPHVVADWAGCESSCNACGQVCPTGAIRALPLEEKRVARMGLAVVNQQTCLPFAEREACQLCVDECHAAGYHAIEFTRVGTEVDERGRPLENTGFLAPVVLPERCVGCGLCQTRCYGINVAEKGLLRESAIVVLAGPGREDRILHGSYRALRQSRQEASAPQVEASGGEAYLPQHLQPHDGQQ